MFEIYQSLLNKRFNDAVSGDDHEYDEQTKNEYSSGFFESFNEGYNPQELFNLGFERNYHWLPKIDRLHKTENAPILIICGAGHLPGEDGILSLLAQSGFEIEKMNSAGEFETYRKASLNTFLAERLVLQQKNFQHFKDQILGKRTPENTWFYEVAKGIITLAEQLQRQKLILRPLHKSYTVDPVDLKKSINLYS